MIDPVFNLDEGVADESFQEIGGGGGISLFEGVGWKEGRVLVHQKFLFFNFLYDSKLSVLGHINNEIFMRKCIKFSAIFVNV